MSGDSLARPTIRLRPDLHTTDELPQSLHPVSRRVLRSRGILRADQLDLSLSSMLGPENLGGLDSAAKLVADAIDTQQRIMVIGDFDADGATGTALAVLGLRAMGASRVEFRVPNRFEFGYGLSPALVETLADDPPDILITVDSGVACIEGVRRARALGCCVIVTDHHLPGPELPPANALVNPNLRGDTFGSKALAGVGVVFYLLGRVRSELRERGRFQTGTPEPNLAQWLDLVALGTVADLVPLDHNNRILVRQGLERIAAGQTRPGVLALLRAGNRDYRFASASDLGFAVAPRLNAAGRLEDMSVGIRCLLADSRMEADALAEQLDALNQQRKDLQAQMQIEAMQQVEEIIAGFSTEPPMAVTLYQSDWHQGIVGLVASRVKDAVHRPVVAFAPDAPGSGTLKGSARSVRGLHLRDALALVDSRNAGLVHAFGGHAMAAGLSLPLSGLKRFEQEFQRAVHDMLEGEGLEAELWIDGEIAPADLGLALALQLEQLGPWGQRFPEPLFRGRFEVTGQRIVGGHHLRLELRPPGQLDSLPAIAFNCSPELAPLRTQLDAVYYLDVNRWQGAESCQLRIERILACN